MGLHVKKYKNICIVCVLTWSLLGVKKKAWVTPRSVSFRGLIQNFRRASPPLSYAESPPESISPSFLNRVAILMHFALKRVRIEGFRQHSPNQTSFKSPPRLINNDNSANPALPVFSALKTVTRKWNLYSGDTLGTMARVP